jgi:DNA repair exonuclease SbcCD ATPase subunit
MAKLLYSAENGQSQVVELGPQTPIATVGRLEDCQIKTNNGSVSRKHAQFTWVGGANEFVELEDLGSSNGTFINDKKITKEVLKNNDKVRCGNFLIDFEASVPAAAPAPSAPAPSAPAPQVDASPEESPEPASGGGLPYLDDPSIAIIPEQVIPSSAIPSKEMGATPSAKSKDIKIPSNLNQEQLKEELERALRRADALSRDVEELRKDNSTLSDRADTIGKSNAEMDALNKQLGAVEQELESERDELEILRKSEGRNKVKIDALSDRNTELKEQFSGLQDQQAELRDRLKESREDLENAHFKRDQSNEDADRLEIEKKSLFEQLTKLKVEYNHLERAHEQIQKDFSLQEFEYKRLDEAHQDLESELRHTLQGENEQVDVVNRLQAIVDEKEDVIKTLKGQIEDLQNQTPSGSEQSSDWLEEVETLKEENEALNVDKNNLENEINALKSIVDTQEQNGGDSGDSDELIQKNEALKEQVAALERNVPASSTALLAQIRELSSEKHQLERQLSGKGVTDESGDNEGASLSSELLQKTRLAFDQINNMVSAWQANLETSQIHLEDLKTLFSEIAKHDFSPVDNAENLNQQISDADPDWACESMTDTVKQILKDSKEIKNKLVNLRDGLHQ